MLLLGKCAAAAAAAACCCSASAQLLQALSLRLGHHASCSTLHVPACQQCVLVNPAHRAVQGLSSALSSASFAPAFALQLAADDPASHCAHLRGQTLV